MSGSLSLLFLLACTKEKSEESSVSDDSGGPEIPANCPAAAFPDPTDTWVHAGFTKGGDVRYFANASNAADTVWIGSTLGGLFRSMDGGHSWESVLLNASNHAEGDLLPDPANPGSVFYTAGSLWRVGPAGSQFLNLGSSQQDRVRTVAVAEDGSIWAIDALSAVYHSVDDGQSWEKLSEVLMTPAPFETELDAGSARELNNSFWSMGITQKGVLVAANHGGKVYLSDNGIDWRATFAEPVMLTSFAVLGEEVWVGSGANIYHSTDGAETFEQVLTLPADVVALELSGAGVPAIATVDQVQVGLTGTPVTLPVSRIMGLGYAGETLMVGHHEGILRSEDGGVSFTESDTDLVADDPSVIGIHPACPGLMMVGTWCTRGLYRSTDGGLDFEHESETFAHYVMVIAASAVRAEDYWVTADRSLWYSNDFGLNWENRSPVEAHLHGLAIDPERPDSILIGSVGSGEDADTTGQLYWTEDAGKTWTIAKGIPPMESSVHAIEFWPGNPEVVLMGTNSGGIFHTEGDGDGLFRSEDRGHSWEAVPSLPARSIRMLKICAPTAWVLAESGLFRSDDQGISWVPVAEGDWLAMACKGEGVVVGGIHGIRRSVDLGKTWEDWAEGVEKIEYGKNGAQLEFTPDGKLVYFGEAVTGVWYRGW